MEPGWDNDDDVPPLLSTLPDQVHAVKLSNSIIGTAALKTGELRPATTTDARSGILLVLPAAAPVTRPLKRGFLDAKPQQSSSSSSSSRKPQQSSSSSSRSLSDKQQHSSSSSSQQGMPLLTGKAAQQPGGKQIPEFLRLEPSEEQKQLQAMRSQLLSALQPTPETVAEVGKDATLMAGFEDPEVMAAVAEVARDPSAIRKHANNPKVLKFFEAMGSLVGSKLEKQPQQLQQQSSSRSSHPPRERLP